jgi:hypothetical protein
MSKFQIITLCLIVTYGWMLYLWRKNREAVARFVKYKVLKHPKPVVPIPVEVTRSGMTTVQVENIDSINEVDWTQSMALQFVKVPMATQMYIRTLSGTRIAHGALYANTSSKDKTENEDIRRGLTLASCFYNFAIPASAVLIDDLTKQYMYGALRDAYPVLVTEPPPPAVIQGGYEHHGMEIPDDEDMLRYMDMTIQVGAVLTIFAELPMYPSRPAFTEELKTRAGPQLRQLNHKKLPSNAELFSMITAFAYYTKLPIPRAYIEENLFTAMLIRELKYRHHKPKLSLVKTNKGNP